MTKIRTIELDNDLIEIHYNKNLSKKPYLVRVFSYFHCDPNEIRLDEDEIKDLFNVLKKHKLL